MIFGWSNTKIGQKMADGQLAMESLCVILEIFVCKSAIYVIGSVKRGFIAFPIACTWQPITSIVIKVPL